MKQTFISDSLICPAFTPRIVWKWILLNSNECNSYRDLFMMICVRNYHTAQKISDRHPHAVVEADLAPVLDSLMLPPPGALVDANSSPKHEICAYDSCEELEVLCKSLNVYDCLRDHPAVVIKINDELVLVDSGSNISFAITEINTRTLPIESMTQTFPRYEQYELGNFIIGTQTNNLLVPGINIRHRGTNGDAKTYFKRTYGFSTVFALDHATLNVRCLAYDPVQMTISFNQCNFLYTVKTFTCKFAKSSWCHFLSDPVIGELTVLPDTGSAHTAISSDLVGKSIKLQSESGNKPFKILINPRVNNSLPPKTIVIGNDTIKSNKRKIYFVSKVRMIGYA